MKREVKPIPDEYRTITPALTVRHAAEAIEFYKEAFGAQERSRMTTPDGKWVIHAELQIGDSLFMLGEEMPGMEHRSPQSLGGASVGFYVYVEDVDTVFERAVAAGATVKEPLADMFWGDRVGTVLDPSGHVWMLATHVENVDPEEMRKRGQQAMEKMLQGAERP
jgi:PhnB protein